MPVLPELSVDEKVTVVTPRGNIFGASCDTTTLISASSLAVAELKNAIIVLSVLAVPLPLVAATKMLLATVITGATESRTVTVLVNEIAALPAASLTLYVKV